MIMIRDVSEIFTDEFRDKFMCEELADVARYCGDKKTRKAANTLIAYYTVEPCHESLMRRIPDYE